MYFLYAALWSWISALLARLPGVRICWAPRYLKVFKSLLKEIRYSTSLMKDGSESKTDYICSIGADSIGVIFAISEDCSDVS